MGDLFTARFISLIYPSVISKTFWDEEIMAQYNNYLRLLEISNDPEWFLEENYVDMAVFLSDRFKRLNRILPSSVIADVSMSPRDLTGLTLKLNGHRYVEGEPFIRYFLRSPLRESVDVQESVRRNEPHLLSGESLDELFLS